MENKRPTFSTLAESISQVDAELATQAARAVNISLTIRNWLFGYFIAEYEQNGTDRAEYGAHLMERLASRLETDGMNAVAPRSLRQYRQFYQVYPEIWQTPSARFFEDLLPVSIWQTVSAKSDKVEKQNSAVALQTSQMVQKLSFSHLAELIKIDDDTKRAFYEIECINGGWSVRELKRQIGSLYYERSGLSLDKKKLSKLANQNAESAKPRLAIRDPYIFEFLGLKSQEVMSESHLEDQLLNKLQDFLLELGNGFCFEARQKRILIGDTHNFVDLVFYHRVLKCHVLVELKLAAFNHENVGQLNTYVSWYRKNMMTENDNPPVGILLCTGKDNSLVEYALAGMDNELFVSKYQLELPAKEQMQRFLDAELSEVK